MPPSTDASGISQEVRTTSPSKYESNLRGLHAANETWNWLGCAGTLGSTNQPPPVRGNVVALVFTASRRPAALCCWIWVAGKLSGSLIKVPNGSFTVTLQRVEVSNGRLELSAHPRAKANQRVWMIFTFNDSVSTSHFCSYFKQKVCLNEQESICPLSWVSSCG